MSAVSDASPLVLLSKAGLLHLLPALFGEIVIPETVAAELRAGEHRHAEGFTVLESDWLHVVPDVALHDAALVRLGRGEAAAMSLALARGIGTTLLIDDLAGRREAGIRGLTVTGSGGVVVLAKREGLIASARPRLERLRDQGLYLGDRAFALLLRLAGEELP